MSDKLIFEIRDCIKRDWVGLRVLRQETDRRVAEIQEAERACGGRSTEMDLELI